MKPEVKILSSHMYSAELSKIDEKVFNERSFQFLLHIK